MLFVKATGVLACKVPLLPVKPSPLDPRAASLPTTRVAGLLPKLVVPV